MWGNSLKQNYTFAYRSPSLGSKVGRVHNCHQVIRPKAAQDAICTRQKKAIRATSTFCQNIEELWSEGGGTVCDGRDGQRRKWLTTSMNKSDKPIVKVSSVDFCRPQAGQLPNQTSKRSFPAGQVVSHPLSEKEPLVLDEFCFVPVVTQCWISNEHGISFSNHFLYFLALNSSTFWFFFTTPEGLPAQKGAPISKRRWSHSCSSPLSGPFRRSSKAPKSLKIQLAYCSIIKTAPSSTKTAHWRIKLSRSMPTGVGFSMSPITKIVILIFCKSHFL